MDITKVGNEYADIGVATYHICVRCIAFYGDGNVRFLGRTGCIMPTVTDATRDLYKAWQVSNKEGEDADFKRCFRCFINNADCCAVPEELCASLDSIPDLLNMLRDGGTATQVSNPEYVAEQAGGDNAAAEFLVEFTELTAEQRELQEHKLTITCNRVSKKISRECAPHAVNLTLHSGAILPEEDPYANAHPRDRQSDKQSMAVKVEVKRRREAGTAE